MRDDRAVPAPGPDPTRGASPPPRRRGLTLAIAVAVTALVGAAACGSSDQPGAATGSTGPIGSTGTTASPATGAITVLAPGPLKPALEKAKVAFETANPGTSVALNLGHVPTLLAQLQEGVPGDVLVTPDEATMSQAQSKGLLAGTPVPVARNQLALVVAKDNPGRVQGVESLGDPSLSIAVCADELPCGRLAAQLAEKAGVTLAADSKDPGGSPAIVTKAAAGEIDLGVVFAVDVKAGGDKVTAVPLGASVSVSSQVMAAALEASQNAATADAFVAFLASPDGRALLTQAGFVAL